MYAQSFSREGYLSVWELDQLYENHLRYDQFHHNVWR